MSPQKSIVFFDGVCHLCNGFVDRIITADHKHLFQFAPLQGETALQLLTPAEREVLTTVILLEDNQVKYKKSAAVLRILTRLGGPYLLFNLGYLIPPALRDALYAWVAKNRYSWFGERDFCRLPTPEERGRLLP